MVKKKYKRKKRKLYGRVLAKTFFSLVTVMVLLSVVFGAFICLFTKPVDTTMLNMKMTSSIYYVNDSGQKIIIENLFSDENRSWVEFEKIPLDMKNAFVAIEDERFYSHPGFDLKRLTSAAFNTVLRIFDKNRSVYGGSTITQQLVKNLTKDDERSFLRKAKEIYRSVRLESDLSKNEILELYLNTIYLSQNCNGVGAASKIYFAKDVSDLSLAECASIAGITQYPSLYDPYLNPEANKTKQLTVLSKMLELNMITQEEYDEAAEEELIFSKDESYKNVYYSYFVDTLIEEVLADLTENYNYSESMAQSLLYTGGLQIKCTIDPQIQAALESVYTDESNYIYKNGELMQSAMVVLDAQSGEIKGVVGGVGDKGGSRTYNRATGTRQPGSSIKPIAVYAPALEYDIIHGASVMSDTPTTFNLGGGATWTPRNSNGNFSDDVSLKTAIARSLNIPAAKVLNEMGLDKSYNFLTNKLGITTLVEKRSTDAGIVSDKALAALSLGGLTDGVTPIEMAAAYATFVNDGYYTEPHTYTEIHDYEGKLLYSKKPSKHRAMKSSTATIMTDLLSGVVAGGTGSSAYFRGPDMAGKTGTTTNNFDKWFVGFTPSLVGATWVGYDSPTAINAYGNPAINFWRQVMSEIDYSERPDKFEDVLSFDSVKRVEICTVSGLRTTEICEELETTYRVYIDKSDVSSIDKCTEEDHISEELLPESTNEQNNADTAPVVTGTTSSITSEAGTATIPETQPETHVTEAVAPPANSAEQL